MSQTSTIGSRITRLEDEPLLRGKGRFVDDITSRRVGTLVGTSKFRIERHDDAHIVPTQLLLLRSQVARDTIRDMRSAREHRCYAAVLILLTIFTNG